MDKEVETSPAFLQDAEDGPDLGVVRHIQRLDQGQAERLGKGTDPTFQRLALVGEGELGAFLMRAPGDPPGQGALVCHADHQAALASEQAACGRGGGGLG